MLESFESGMASLARMSTGGRGKTYDRAPYTQERVETEAQIFKSQSDAVDFVRAGFDPTNITVESWQQDLDDKFTSQYCKDVIKWAGYSQYAMQSNELFDKMKALEKAFRDDHPSEMAGIRTRPECDPRVEACQLIISLGQ